MQVLLTEDSEKARAAAVAALEEGEVLVEPLPLPVSGAPHLASMQSMGSSAYSAVSPAQAASTALSITPPPFPLIQTQGDSSCQKLLCCNWQTQESTHYLTYDLLWTRQCSSAATAAHVAAFGLSRTGKAAYCSACYTIGSPPSASCGRPAKRVTFICIHVFYK